MAFNLMLLLIYALHLLRAKLTWDVSLSIGFRLTHIAPHEIAFKVCHSTKPSKPVSGCPTFGMLETIS